MIPANDNGPNNNDNFQCREPAADDPAVILDSGGDPIRRGTKMAERESYERLIEGLKIAADACMHLSRYEQVNHQKWTALARKLDLVRRGAIHKAGIEDPIAAKETSELRRNPLRYKDGRARLRDGLKQAAGGARQLAVCFRLEISWSQIANSLEDMQRKTTAIGLPSLARRSTSLILPRGYHPS